MQSSLSAGKSPPLQPKGTNGVTLNSSGQVNGIQRRTTPTVNSDTPPPNHSAMEPRLSTSHEDIEESDYNNELSAEAQAHNISMFLSSSTSDSGK